MFGSLTIPIRQIKDEGAFLKIGTYELTAENTLKGVLEPDQNDLKNWVDKRLELDTDDKEAIIKSITYNKVTGQFKVIVQITKNPIPFIMIGGAAAAILGGLVLTWSTVKQIILIPSLAVIAFFAWKFYGEFKK